MRALRFATVCVGVLLLTIGANADADDGARLAAACASCHRLDGRKTGIPSIVGMEPNKLIESMRAFRSDERSNHLMHAMSLTLTDAEVAAIAHHLATLNPKGSTP